MNTAQEHIEKLKAKRKTHLERPRERSADAQRGYCGAVGGMGSTFSDQATAFLGMEDKQQCKVCAAAYRRERDQATAAALGEMAPGPRANDRDPRLGMTRAELAESVARAFIRATRGRASVPELPRKLDPYVWSRTCKGAVFGRCRSCQACEDDAKTDSVNEAEETHAPDRGTTARAPREWIWTDVDSAILAASGTVAESPSPSGFMLEKARLGLLDVQTSGKGDDANMERAGQSAIAAKLLDRVYANDARHKLSAEHCRALLLTATRERTTVSREAPRSMDEIYRQLAEHLGLFQGDVEAIVRYGRQRMEEMLLERKLVKPPKARKRARERASAWVGQAEQEAEVA